MTNNINFENRNVNQSSTNFGGLVVTVTTGSETKPLSGAHVTVSKRNGNKEQIIRTLITDENGRTSVVELPTPPISNSESPGGPIPYAFYDVRVDYPGYYSVENVDIPIFPDNVAFQPVNLIPLPLDTYQGKTKIFNESDPFGNVYEEEREERE